MSDLEYKYFYEIELNSPIGIEKHSVDTFPPYAKGQKIILETWYENADRTRNEFEIDEITHGCKTMKVPASNEVLVTLSMQLSLIEI